MKRTDRQRRAAAAAPSGRRSSVTSLARKVLPGMRIWVFPANTALAAAVRRAARATLTRHGVKTARIHIAIVSDRQMAAWHRKYMGIRGPTDVLTFDARDGESSAGSREAWDLEGDIAVSLDTASREARRRGHSVFAEVCLYAVHGVLHLLGYDDAGAASANRMHAVEDDVLQSLGHGPVFLGASAVARPRGMPLGPRAVRRSARRR